MSETRDDFSAATKKNLALRAGHRCSLQKCMAATAGPSAEGPESVSNVGVAAHIAAAASGPGARRIDVTMTSEARSSIDNAIWLCQSCAKEIDSDEVTWTRARLGSEKQAAETRAREALGRSRPRVSWRRARVAFVVAAGFLAASWGVSEWWRSGVREGPSDPRRWVRFERLSVYRVMPDPAPGAPQGIASHDSFVGVVLELRNDSNARTFEVQDLLFEGRVALVPVEGGGIVSQIEGFGAPSQVVRGSNLQPKSRGWAAIAFPFVHRDTASAPLGGVMPRFDGTWRVIVDGTPLVVTPTSNTEGTVFLSKWSQIVEDINLKLEPVLQEGAPRGPWERAPHP